MDRFFDVREWARDRNLIEGSTPAQQSLKLIEELGELSGALARLSAAEDDPMKKAELLAKIKDGFGDSLVVLIIMAAQVGLQIEVCLEAAWLEIKDRKGQMIDGVFVKEDDLHP